MLSGSEIISTHPVGEVSFERPKADWPPSDAPLRVDTVGPHRFYVSWAQEATVTSVGSIVFFSQLLATGGLYSEWVQKCPLKYKSPNAPEVGDGLGSWVLAFLSGASRYTHLSAMNRDSVSPEGLGMKKMVCEDSLRRAFSHVAKQAAEQWMKEAFEHTYLPAWEYSWICVLDVTLKTIYGRQQEGAQGGYNPHKPGRPSHAFHSLFVRELRLVLDVEVHSGKEHSPVLGLDNTWRMLDKLPQNQKPWLVCGDAAYGNERQM